MARKKSPASQSQSLFRDPSGQGDLFEKSLEEELAERKNQPVECLGQTFPNDDARREHYLGLLRQGLEELHEKLGGVEFTSVDEAVDLMQSIGHWPMGERERLTELAKRIEDGHRKEREKDLHQLWKDQVGFPHGEIEDILALSDPPYYTACPSPFLADFVEQWVSRKRMSDEDAYNREPFAVDVSEGKNDPIYNAHAYHTKVPHKAIMRYILHYTRPGDIVLDGFCGTGMVGVAARLCGERDAVEGLGLQVAKDGQVFQDGTAEDGRDRPVRFSQLGVRHSILSDLSPVATFVSTNYGRPFDVEIFGMAAGSLLKQVEDRLGWMYETRHPKTGKKGHIRYTVWSEVFSCPQCGGEIVFVEQAFDREAQRVRDEFACSHCGVSLDKSQLHLMYETFHDEVIGGTARRPKRVPVFINYSLGKERFEKALDGADHEVLGEVDALEMPPEVPATELPPMQMAKVGRMQPAAITHVHHFFLRRAGMALGLAWSLAKSAKPHRLRMLLLFLVEQAIWTISVLNRFRPSGYSQVNQYLAGVFYVPSQHSEPSLSYILEGKVSRLLKAFRALASGAEHDAGAVSTGDCGNLGLQSSSVDYIFTDPPFGENIYYADLNFLIESWHGVWTNALPEAIVDRVRQKVLGDYQHLMRRCFKEYYRVLKPGRWMTVEFHNSRNSVWNAIQEALQDAGFVVADVRTLDKKQGSFQQVTSERAVKQDLVISAYKPNAGFEERFRMTAGSDEGVWDFVRSHLEKLPLFVGKGDAAEVISERRNYLLFDRMVAFHVRKGVSVPLSAGEFYTGLSQFFPERDGMYFLEGQVAEYDRRRLTVKKLRQLELIPSDESSAVQWLRQQLSAKPQTFQELHPQFMQAISGWSKHEKPLELREELLEQNFLCYDGQDEVPSQIHSYLSTNFKELRKLDKDDTTLREKAKGRWYVPDPSKVDDLEKLRERALLREFDEYRESKQRRLKVFRLEAVRAGFKMAWQNRDYPTIIEVAKKIPESVLQEDPKLLMWYDQALTRTGDDA